MLETQIPFLRLHPYLGRGGRHGQRFLSIIRRSGEAPRRVLSPFLELLLFVDHKWHSSPLDHRADLLRHTPRGKCSLLVLARYFQPGCAQSIEDLRLRMQQEHRPYLGNHIRAPAASRYHHRLWHFLQFL